MTLRRLGKHQLPFDEEHPLVFHVLTAGSSAVPELLPFSYREEAGSNAGPAEIGVSDLAAGDGQYVFMSLGYPYRGHDNKRFDIKTPAVAFDLRDLQSRFSVCFRPHDLEGAYKQLGNFIGDSEFYEGYGDDFGQIADWGTQSRRRAVTALCRLHLRAMIRGRDFRALAQPFFTKVPRQEDIEPAEWYPDIEENENERGELGARHALQAAADQVTWSMPFRGGNFHHDKDTGLWLPDYRHSPEILVADAVPLSLARFFRGPDGVWVDAGNPPIAHR